MKVATHVILRGIAALAAGLVVFQIEAVSRMPGFWAGTYPIYYDWTGHFTIFGAIYLAVPLLILVTSSVLRKGHLSLASTCGVPVVWSGLVFLLWAHKPWAYYGEFPWWMVTRDLVPACGAALTMGWAYWRLTKTRYPTRHSTGTAQ